MTSGEIPLPSCGAVEAALLETTGFLARELSHAGDAAPRWSEFEWRVAEAVAAMQGVSGLLRETLRWTGPPHWQTFLEEQKYQTLLRQRRVAELLSALDGLARAEGLGFVALKGAALLNLGIYRPGTRPLADLDLLVDPDDVDVASRLMTSLGYVEILDIRRHKVFVARDARRGYVGFGEHIDNPVNIELHSRIAASLPVSEVDITSLVLPRRPLAGSNAYPSTTALMRHVLLNAAGDLMARGLRFIQLHDIARLAARMTAADWDELTEPRPTQSGAWWALPPLMLTARYHADAIPPSVIEAIAPRCPWWLRRISKHHELADVSWSKFRIPAFPGIEWSRSPREALRYATSRVWPSREARSETSRALAADPRLGGSPWYGLSRTGRMLRWIVSRPPRVQTMLSVRAALGHELH